MSDLEKEHGNLSEAFLKSDQAGCYKTGMLIQYITKRNSTARLKVKRYDFSEAQSGKDVCDSRSACAKFHMLKFIDQGHNVETAKQMKEALDSSGGVKGLKTCVVDINQKVEPKAIAFALTISQYSSFLFEEDGVKVWKAYNIGSGKSSTFSKQFPNITGLKVNFMNDCR